MESHARRTRDLATQATIGRPVSVVIRTRTKGAVASEGCRVSVASNPRAVGDRATVKITHEAAQIVVAIVLQVPRF